MIKIQAFSFNAFQVNCYIVSNDEGKCFIVDPGCSTKNEKQRLYNYISSENLTPELIIYTHAHIDHILGAKAVAEHYQIKVAGHKDGEYFLDSATSSASLYGMEFDGSAYPEIYLNESAPLMLGEEKIQILETPGHADGSISLYMENDNFVIVGDVLFRDSIGRTDLPTGDYDVLMNSINSKLFTLSDDTTVYPGHGPSTSIGYEKVNNPFVKVY